MKLKLESSLVLVLAILSLCLLLTSCSPNVLTTLKIIVDTTESAIPILASEGVNIPPQIPEYVAAVADCIGSQTGTPTVQQLLEISGCLTKQIAPTLKPGTSQKVVSVINAVVKAVQDYLAGNPVAPKSMVAATVKTGTKPLSVADEDKVRSLRFRAVDVTVKARALAKR